MPKLKRTCEIPDRAVDVCYHLTTGIGKYRNLSESRRRQINAIIDSIYGNQGKVIVTLFYNDEHIEQESFDDKMSTEVREFSQKIMRSRLTGILQKGGSVSVIVYAPEGAVASGFKTVDGEWAIAKEDEALCDAAKAVPGIKYIYRKFTIAVL